MTRKPEASAIRLSIRITYRGVVKDFPINLSDDDFVGLALEAELAGLTLSELMTCILNKSLLE